MQSPWHYIFTDLEWPHCPLALGQAEVLTAGAMAVKCSCWWGVTVRARVPKRVSPGLLWGLEPFCQRHVGVDGAEHLSEAERAAVHRRVIVKGRGDVATATPNLNDKWVIVVLWR